VAEGLKLLLQKPDAAPASRAKRPKTAANGKKAKPESTERSRGSLAEWARKFAGIAKLAPGETTDELRMEHYANKYDV
jgi:hypothetical protein